VCLDHMERIFGNIERGCVWTMQRGCFGSILSGVLVPDRAVCWDHTERCVGTIQSGVLGPYRVVCWDHTERCVGTIQSGVLEPYGEGEVSAFNGCKKERLNLQKI
jgi:hypothetical protein